MASYSRIRTSVHSKLHLRALAGLQSREPTDGPKRGIDRFLMENLLAPARSSGSFVAPAPELIGIDCTCRNTGIERVAERRCHSHVERWFVASPKCLWRQCDRGTLNARWALLGCERMDVLSTNIAIDRRARSSGLGLILLPFLALGHRGRYSINRISYQP